jgi:outer membrane protein assembly factor BamB
MSAQLRRIVCPGCGATVPPLEADAKSYVCTFCNEAFAVERDPLPSPPSQPGAVKEPVSRGALMLGLGVLAVLVILAAPFVLRHQTAPPARLTPTPIAPASTPLAVASTDAAPTTTDTLLATSISFDWDVAPLVIDMNGDGVEDFTESFDLDKPRGGVGAGHSLGGFDGKTFELLWSVPVAGTYRLVRVADRAGLAVGTGTLSVVDLKTGKQTPPVTLTDTPMTVCAPSDDAHELWVELFDQKHVMFDLSTGSTTRAARPTWCAGNPFATKTGRWRSTTSILMREQDEQLLRCVRDRDLSTCAPASAAPTIAGFKAEYVISEQGLAVAVGVRVPGTARGVLVGLDAKTRKVRWKTEVAADADAAYQGSPDAIGLANGRLVARYKTTHPTAYYKWHLAAFDARDGTRLWDVTTDETNESAGRVNMTLTSQRVYTYAGGALDIRDATTGKSPRDALLP